MRGGFVSNWRISISGSRLFRDLGISADTNGILFAP